MRLLRPFLILGALFFALTVVLIPLFQEHNYSLGQTKTETTLSSPLSSEDSPDRNIEGTPSGVLQKEVDYYLPYPGILPDHPLYWVKMIRDRILLFFTKDSTALFERLLLYADKRIGAAEVLIKGGKQSLGVSTATKAEKYLERAVSQLEELKKESKMTALVADKALNAAAKHKEILEELVDKTTENKGVFSQALEMTERSHQKVLQIVEKD